MEVVIKACFSFSTPFQRRRGYQLCALCPRVWSIPPDSGWGTVPRHRGRQTRTSLPALLEALLTLSASLDLSCF